MQIRITIREMVLSALVVVLAVGWWLDHRRQSVSGSVVPMLTCYYAHPMLTYGTPQEAEDVQLLESFGFRVINPNVPENKNKDMAYFCGLAANADLVAFRSLPDGKISHGVGLELKTAKRIVELPTSIEQRSHPKDQ